MCPHGLPALAYRVNPFFSFFFFFFFFFFTKKQKNSKLRKIMYWFRAGLPTLQGVGGGLTSSGVSSDQHSVKQHSESIHFFFFFFGKKLKKSKVVNNYVLVPTPIPGGGGRLDILWCVLRPALSEATFRVNPFFLFFFIKKIKKIKSCEKLCTGSGQAYPHSRGWGEA